MENGDRIVNRVEVESTTNENDSYTTNAGWRHDLHWSVEPPCVFDIEDGFAVSDARM